MTTPPCRRTCSPTLSHASRSDAGVTSAALLPLWLALSIALGCGDGDPSGLTLTRDAEAVTSPEETEEEPAVEEPGEPSATPKPVELPPESGGNDAGALEDASLDGEADAAEDSDAASEADGALDDAAAADASSEIDGAGQELDAGELDADLGDAQVGDGSLDADDGACADGAARDACGVCGGGATTCHPLFGRYAARTQLYARLRSEVMLDTPVPLDMVSKGELYSIVEIDAQGRASEHYCLLEIGGPASFAGSPVEVASWVRPSASQRIADTNLQLQQSGDRYTRAASSHRAYYGWRPDACTSSTALPTASGDCRLRDTDQDTQPGGTMFLDLAGKPDDPESESSTLALYVAAQLSFGWSLPASPGPRVVGTISGGFQLTELARAGDAAELLGDVQNTLCPEDLGHIELVRSESASCATILADRADAGDLFDVSLDAPFPAPSACLEPACARDADSDGTADCNDRCPNDATKTEPGTCGCAVAETDSDGDGTPNCVDACPNDRNKVAAGTCGCGVADTNSDNDSQPDCRDECPTDGTKTARGACGCGVAETDSDGDGRPNCTDGCPNDRNKFAAGACGCGVADTNSDNDSQPDCRDECDADPNKTAAGVCGCGVRDQDLNGDGTIDCSDACPNDPTKVAPGLCGCGVPDTNADNDAQPDCRDECDSDPNKTAAGACGCGVADTDSDNDRVPNCNDACPNDPAKTTLGRCGCGVAETDSDGDGTPNCIDACPNDRAKVAAGLCGCGVADTNTDGDALPDCTDACDSNPNLTVAGPCGCEACPTTNPLVGTYAVRTSIYSKQRNGTTLEQTKALNYSLVTITQLPNGQLQMTDRGCWNQTVPNGGTGAYAWAKPAWAQAVPPIVRTLTPNGNGTYTRPAVPTHYGWDPARQPSACSASSTPLQPWAWGSTCTCNSPASSLPPYDRNGSGFDCRAVDSDGDGQPGMSGVAGLSNPGIGAESGNGLATAFAVSTLIDTWNIAVGSEGRHTATIDDRSVSQVIGCTGSVLACGTLPTTPPPSVTCPAASNKAFFVPVSGANASCSAIISQRNTLFAGANDGPWPDNTVCPPP